MPTLVVNETPCSPFYKAVNEYLHGMGVTEGTIQSNVLSDAIREFTPETRVKIRIMLRSVGRIR